MNAFRSHTTTTSMFVPPAVLNMDDVMLKKELASQLAVSMEGRCGKFGYIRVGSIVVTKIMQAHMEIASLNGYIRLLVEIDMVRCMAEKSQVYLCKVEEKNSYGLRVLCEDDTETVLQIIVPFDKDERAKACMSGTTVRVCIASVTFGIGDANMYAVANIVDDDADSHVGDVDVTVNVIKNDLDDGDVGDGGDEIDADDVEEEDDDDDECINDDVDADIDDEVGDKEEDGEEAEDEGEEEVNNDDEEDVASYFEGDDDELATNNDDSDNECCGAASP